MRAQSMLDFAIEVDAPAGAGCTPASQLEQQIETRIDRVVFLHDAAPSRHLRVSIAQASEGVLRARVEMRDAQGVLLGQRELSDGAVCHELDEALILVLSTLIGTSGPAPLEPPSAPREAARPTSPPARSSAAAEPEAAHLPLVVGVSAGARADLGLLPELAVGVAVGVQLEVGRVAAMFGVGGVPIVRHDLGLEASARFRALIASAQLCWDMFEGSLELAACGGTDGGVIEQRTYGLLDRDSTAHAFLRAAFAIRLRTPARGPFGLVFGLSGVAPLYAPRYFFVDTRGARRYYHAVELGLSAALDLIWRFSS